MDIGDRCDLHFLHRDGDEKNDNRDFAALQGVAGCFLYWFVGGLKLDECIALLASTELELGDLPFLVKENYEIIVPGLW